MKSRTGVALLIGFGSLLLLVAILGFGALRRANAVYEQMLADQLAFEEVDRAVRDLPADIHLAGILVRDYVLDPSPRATPLYKAQLVREQQVIERHISRLSALRHLQTDKVDRLQKETQAYVDSLDPMLNWSPEEKVSKSHGFIRDNLLSRHDAIVTLAQEIAMLNAQNLAAARAARERNLTSLRRFIGNLLWVCLSLGLLVATLSTRRVIRLEARSTKERERAEEAEREQRRLASRVVQAQEEERKRVSLELHDDVGQLASAQGMELGRLQSANLRSPAEFRAALAEIKRMNTDIVRAIRDLAGGLRPSMLDDLGLGSAIRSHARAFSRRFGVSVQARLEGAVDTVPEPHRTCAYRIVQEALNNCGRHAQAKQIMISLQAGPDQVRVGIQDDGVGFHADRRSGSGLGLIGIEERVRDLGGTVTITSSPGQGTLVAVVLPMKETMTCEDENPDRG